uniref:Uncharacterized protein n=1 Tax=Anguilla anguilla TaxID=7936 RepID=A0A0E9QNS4_ANGAN
MFDLPDCALQRFKMAFVTSVLASQKKGDFNPFEKKKRKENPRLFYI